MTQQTSRAENITVNIVNLVQCSAAIPALARWHHAEWSHYNPGQTMDDRMQQMQSYLCDDLVPSTWVAMQDNEVIGSAAIVANDMESHQELTPWLASVYVKTDCRCRGVGARLVRHVMQQASNTGVEALYLFTPDQQEFYQRLGWQVMQMETYHHHEVTIMAVSL